jgi:hypothetical protein
MYLFVSQKHILSMKYERNCEMNWVSPKISDEVTHVFLCFSRRFRPPN